MKSIAVTYTPAPTAVDLGLPSGTRWADMNVGAGSETGYGTYYAWAATASQADYSQANAPYYSGSAYTKYTGSDYTMLQRGDDAATVNWGSNWRMPTDTELQELIDNTTKEWKTNYNETGVNGYLVTSKTNGNSIFLPAAGWYNGTELRSASQGGNYWMSTVVTSDVSCGYSLNFYSTGYAPYKDNTDTRFVGFSIRPVQMFAGEGTESSPYLIASTADWNNLVSAVNAGETYSGNYFKMTANVGTVTTWMTGTFSGTFDGDGKTLTVDYSATTENCAPFGTLSGATVKKLKVAGSISSNQKLVAGIAALCSSTGNNVTNCLVSATINSGFSGNAADGGLVAVVDDGASLNVTGCAFVGKLLTTNGTTSCGGIVGWRRPNGTVTITNCLYAPASATGSETWIASADGENGNANFCRWNSSEPTITNCYYTTDFGSGNFTAQGIQARTIAAGDYVSTLSVTKGDATPTYDVSGITVYSTGISFNDGSTTTFYGGSGQSVSLALTAETRTGYQFKQYAASQGTLSGQTATSATLTMPAANSTANDVVTISAEYDPLYNATFADASDASNGWSISPTSGIVGSTVTVRYEGENKVKSVTVAPKGALTGKFSVSSTSQVQFSKGNLQYVGSWQFAANQYDIFGASQSDDHRDLFGWGTKTNPNNTSTTNGDYSWAEWGENTITNGCTGWRTLTKDEWGYLFSDRANASTLRTFATVNDVTGLIIMPDGWTASGVTLTITTANYTTNDLSTSQWATLEKQGCVFLPAAGGRIGNNLYNVGSIGDYWSSDASGGTNAYDLNFSNDNLLPQYKGGQRHYGWSVRLVRDVELALCSLSEVTSEHVGKIIGADGNVYASLAQAEKVTSAVGVLGKVTETGHGLIMSLEDAPQQVWATIDGWASASYAGTTLKVLPNDDARGSNLPSYTTLGSTTVSNWAVATRADYTAIFTNLGSTGGDNDGISYDANMNAKITGAGGTAISGGNWSSTQYDSSKAWRFDSTWGGRNKTDQYKVRPVLGF